MSGQLLWLTMVVTGGFCIVIWNLIQVRKLLQQLVDRELMN